MKQEFIKANNHGELILEQNLETERGLYTFKLKRYNNDVYYFKELNKKLVECGNASKMKAVKK